jgi:transposase
MKSKPYKATSVKNVSIAQLVSDHNGTGCDVGFDTSKTDIMVVVRWFYGVWERPWRVELSEVPILVQKLQELGDGRDMVIAMEPSGTYADPVRQALNDAGLKVYRVSPKASHDYAEILDGVPSQHDGKDAACVAELSSMKKREEWKWDVSTQELRYEIDWMDAHQQVLTKWLGRLEGLLGRLWPEVTRLLPLSSVTLLKMLEHYGSPRAVAEDREAEVRLKKWSGGQLSAEKISEVLQSASRTLGVRSQDADVKQVQRYARAALENQREVNRSKGNVKESTKGNELIKRQAKVVGHGTAAVLWAHLQDPRNYHCAAAYRKSMGLNLKERSSGRWKGHIKITKRGPSQVRRWLYFAALRWCQDSWVRPWYEAKKKRGEGHAKRALIGLMRRLAMALYHVAAGEEFDVKRLVPGAERYHTKKKKKRRSRGCVAGS